MLSESLYKYLERPDWYPRTDEEAIEIAKEYYNATRQKNRDWNYIVRLFDAIRRSEDYVIIVQENLDIVLIKSDIDWSYKELLRLSNEKDSNIY